MYNCSLAIPRHRLDIVSLVKSAVDATENALRVPRHRRPGAARLAERESEAVVGVGVQAASHEGKRIVFSGEERRKRGKALSIVKSVGRLPLDKIIIYPGSARKTGGKKGDVVATNCGIERRGEP